MPLENILLPDAFELAENVRKEVRQGAARHAAAASFTNSLYTVTDVEQAGKILKKLPGKLGKAAAYNWKSITLLKLGWAQREQQYVGRYVAPPTELNPRHMRGVLKLVYDLCAAAKLNPQAHFVDAGHDTEIWLDLPVPAATSTPSSIRGPIG